MYCVGGKKKEFMEQRLLVELGLLDFPQPVDIFTRFYNGELYWSMRYIR